MKVEQGKQQAQAVAERVEEREIKNKDGDG
jgi:hypothetical protein